MDEAPRRIFSLRDLFILVGVIALGCAFLFPMVEQARESARRMSCSNHLRQLVIAIYNYESTFKVLPTLAGGTDGPNPETSNQGRLAPNISLLPFDFGDPIYNQIMNGFPIATRGGSTVPGGPAPWITLDGGYTPWRAFGFSYTETNFRCPSDSGTMDKLNPYDMLRTNYAYSLGDSCEGANWKWSKDANRGMFQARYQRKLRDAPDGLSNTLLMAEIGTNTGIRRVQGWVVNGIAGVESNPSLCLKTASQGRYLPVHAKSVGDWRGKRWPDGSIVVQGINTILPPNSPSCSPHPFPNDWDWGIYSASSYHPGGVNVAMSDGRVVFVSELIDAGDATKRAPGYENRTPPGAQSITASPFGVWGAIGSRNGQEVIPSEFFEGN